MKKTSIIGALLALLCTGTVATSCEDMLSPEMTNNVDGGAAITDTVYNFHGILKSVQDIAERTVILGEARGDLTSTGLYVSDSVYEIANYQPAANGSSGLLDRSAYYKVINQCNFYFARVDTNALMNDTYYMRREYAQVQMIRAWVYMQLVQNYGSVPFITEPVDNANTGWENTAPKATRSNLLSLLLSDNLEQAYRWSDHYGLPSYRSYNTYNATNTTINSQLCMFPADLVMGDLYLFGAKDSMDYVQAATYYYNYITDNDLAITRSRAATFDVFSQGTDEESYSSSVSSWASVFSQYGRGELVTVIPSCAVSTMGTVLTDVQQIYGFELSSNQSVDVSTGDDGTEQTDITGSITPTASEQYRQLIPSTAYMRLNAAQMYAGENTRGVTQAELDYYENAGDARVDGSAPTVRVQSSDGTMNRDRFIHKFCPASNVNSFGSSGFSFHYCIPVYRTSLIYLRYAEALNRAGFPQHAFAILSHGLIPGNLPTMLDSTKVNANGQLERVYYLDSTTIEGRAQIGIDELRRARMATAFLNVGMMPTDNVIGIHSLGCGGIDVEDTLYTFNKVVAQRISDEKTRVTQNPSAGAEAAKRFLRQTEGDQTTDDGDGTGDDDAIEPPYEGPNKDAQNAVEDLIVDELALETAFEGYRFGDLQRIADHKNMSNSGYGTEWFAWKISRRDEDLAPYENPTQKNETLYSLLLNTQNWYLQNP